MTRILVVGGCGLLLLWAVGAVCRWGDLMIIVPWTRREPEEVPTPASELVRRVMWWTALVVLTAIVAGIPVAGAGGRLVMRLLAATSSESAQGRLTEADEVVGKVTVGGTLGLLFFAGVAGGLVAAASYCGLRRWLPAGRWGGVLLGITFVLVGATRLEPLRGDNPDFTLVGPAGLAVGAFVALVVLQGMTTAAVAARLSRSLPEVSRRPGAVAPYLPLLLLIPAGGVAVSVLLVGFVIAVVSTRPAAVSAWRSARTVAVGRAVLVVAVAIAAVGAVSTLSRLVD